MMYIFKKNGSLHFWVKFFDFKFTFADFVYTMESISIKRTFIKWTLYKADIFKKMDIYIFELSFFILKFTFADFVYTM